MMKDRIKTVSRIIETITNVETGEVIDTSIKEVKVLIDPEEFSLVYAGLWNVLLDSPLSKTDIEMLGYLIQNYSDGTPFTINSFLKKELAIRCNKAATSYDKCTKVLLDNGLIYKVDKRIYKINPRYAFKGSSKNRHQAVINMRSICSEC